MAGVVAEGVVAEEVAAVEGVEVEGECFSLGASNSSDCLRCVGEVEELREGRR